VTLVFIGCFQSGLLLRTEASERCFHAVLKASVAPFIAAENSAQTGGWGTKKCPTDSALASGYAARVAPRQLSQKERASYQSLEDVVGCKWSAAVVAAIAQGVQRPGELERCVPGISKKVLTERLRRLLAYGLIARTEYPGLPLRVDYTLTPSGTALAALLGKLRDLNNSISELTAPELVMQLTSLQVGRAKDVAEAGTQQWWDKEWRTGFYKQATADSQWLGFEGFSNDEQADRKYHGGVDKAVCVYPLEHYAHWQAVLQVSELAAGAFGENFTTRGLVEAEVCIGDVFSVGKALVQVSQPRQPCWKIARRWRVKDLTAQVVHTGFTGYYFRVLRSGAVQVGDELRLQERTAPHWSVARCNAVRRDPSADPTQTQALAALDPLSGSWKDALQASRVV
jgi:MOSC domain-containing protein YiiM/DNA-binding HxlR family transcriptional regulator